MSNVPYQGQLFPGPGWTPPPGVPGVPPGYVPPVMPGQIPAPFPPMPGQPALGPGPLHAPLNSSIGSNPLVGGTRAGPTPALTTGTGPRALNAAPTARAMPGPAAPRVTSGAWGHGAPSAARAPFTGGAHNPFGVPGSPGSAASAASKGKSFWNLGNFDATKAGISSKAKNPFWNPANATKGMFGNPAGVTKMGRLGFGVAGNLAGAAVRDAGGGNMFTDSLGWGMQAGSMLGPTPMGAIAGLGVGFGNLGSELLLGRGIDSIFGGDSGPMTVESEADFQEQLKAILPDQDARQYIIDQMNAEGKANGWDKDESGNPQLFADALEMARGQVASEKQYAQDMRMQNVTNQFMFQLGGPILQQAEDSLVRATAISQKMPGELGELYLHNATKARDRVYATNQANYAQAQGTDKQYAAKLQTAYADSERTANIQEQALVAAETDNFNDGAGQQLTGANIPTFSEV